MRTDITINDGNVAIEHGGKSFGSFPATSIAVYRSQKEGNVTVKNYNTVVFDKPIGDVWVNGTQLDESNLLALTDCLACYAGTGSGGGGSGSGGGTGATPVVERTGAYYFDCTVDAADEQDGSMEKPFRSGTEFLASDIWANSSELMKKNATFYLADAGESSNNGYDLSTWHGLQGNWDLDNGYLYTFTTWRGRGKKAGLHNGRARVFWSGDVPCGVCATTLFDVDVNCIYDSTGWGLSGVPNNPPYGRRRFYFKNCSITQLYDSALDTDSHYSPQDIILTFVFCDISPDVTHRLTGRSYMSNCTFMSAPSVLDVSYMGAIVTTHGFVFLPENSRLDASNCSGITVLMGNMATCTLVNCVLGERDGQGTEHTGSVKVYKESTDMTYLPSPIAQAEVVECEFNCLSSLIPLLNFSDLQAKVNMCLDGSSYGEVYMPSGYDGTNRSQFWEYRQLGNLRYAGAGRNRDPSNAGQDAGRILFGTPIDSVRMCTSELVLAPETYSFIALSFGSNSRALHFRTESNGGLNFNMQRLGNKDTLNMLSPSWAYFNNGRLQPPLVDMTLDMEDYGKWNTETCRAAAIQLANPKRSSGMWRNRASQPAADFVSAFPLNAGGQAKGADVQFGFLDIRFNKNMEMQILFEGLFSALSTPEKIDWGLSLSENYALSLSIRSFPNGSMDSDYDFDSLIGIGESNTSKVQIAGDIAENRIEGIVTIDIDNPPAPDTKIDTFMKFVIDLKARTWIPDIEYACVELTTHFPNIATAAFS